MRYYKIKITSPSGQLWTPPGFGSVLGPDASYTSFVNGQTLPGAWDVMLDIPVVDFASPDSAGAAIQIKGVSLAEIAQANNLLGYGMEVFGGMQAGLPLATAQAANAGRLVQGQIYQAFGNWIGNEMTLDFLVVAGSPPPSLPANLTYNMMPGTPMATAIMNTLTQAFPNMSPAPTISISGNLMAQQFIGGVYDNLTLFAQFVLTQSKMILSGSVSNYQGVRIVPVGNSFLVIDGTAVSTSQPNQLMFQDLIGQPTWIEFPRIQIKTVMRADIKQGDDILLPQGLLTTTTAAGAVPLGAGTSVRDNSVFQGTFKVQTVHHYGQFRQSDAASWCTVINAIPTSSSSATGGASFSSGSLG